MVWQLVKILLVKFFRCISTNVKGLVFVVAFDGYKASTKDMTQNVRSGKKSQVVKIIAENSFPPDSAKFLRNYANTQRFVNELA